MAEPFNYGAGFIPPSQFIASGFGMGQQIAQARRERDRLAFEKQQAEKLTTAQTSLAAAKTAESEAATTALTDYKNAVSALIDKPDATGKDFLQVALMAPPEAQKTVLAAWGKLSEEQQGNRLKHSGEALALLVNGQNDLAAQRLDDLAKAATEAGNTDDAAMFGRYSQLVKTSPETAQKIMAMGLAHTPGGEKVLENVYKAKEEERKAAMAPAELEKAIADAKKAGSDAEVAAVASQFAESNAAKDLEKKGYEIALLAAEPGIKQQNIEIARLNAKIGQERNDLDRKRLEQDREILLGKRDEAIQTKVAEGEAAVTSITDARGVVDEILSPENADTLAAATGASAWRALLPGTAVYDMGKKIERLENMIAATNLDKLKGAMSDKDIVFLKNIGTTLSRWQTEKGFTDELKRLGETLDKAQQATAKKFGLVKAIQTPPTAPTTPTSDIRAQADAILGGE